MIFDKYLNQSYLNILYTNYDENYLLSIDEDNFKDVYMLLKEEGFYFIDDIILNYLELFQIDVEYVRKAFTKIKEMVGSNYIKVVGTNMDILDKVIDLAYEFSNVE